MEKSETNHCFFAVGVKEHGVIDWKVSDVSLLADDPLVGKHNGRIDMILRRGEQVVQGAVNRIVFPRLHLNGQDTRVRIIVDKEVNFQVENIHFSIEIRLKKLHFSIKNQL